MVWCLMKPWKKEVQNTDAAHALVYFQPGATCRYKKIKILRTVKQEERNTKNMIYQILLRYIWCAGIMHIII